MVWQNCLPNKFKGFLNDRTPLLCLLLFFSVQKKIKLQVFNNISKAHKHDRTLCGTLPSENPTLGSIKCSFSTSYDFFSNSHKDNQPNIWIFCMISDDFTAPGSGSISVHSFQNRIQVAKKCTSLQTPSWRESAKDVARLKIARG